MQSEENNTWKEQSLNSKVGVFSFIHGEFVFKNENRLILCTTRLTEPRHFSNIGRGTFRSKIYLPPVITPWQRRFPGVSRPVTFVYVPVSLCLQPSFSLRAPSPCIPLGTRPCPHYNGITCPHITLAVPARNTRFLPTFRVLPSPSLPNAESYFFLLGYVPSPGYPLAISWFGACAVFTVLSRARRYREHAAIARKIELETAQRRKIKCQLPW